MRQEMETSALAGVIPILPSQLLVLGIVRHEVGVLKREK
jgi:hypothetical protein